jgi:hypothetical protein
MNATGGNMEDNRKKWIQPQLIVLGRGTPEENVLAGCKTLKLTSMSATKTSCKKKLGANCNSTKCSVISTTS